jgi:hypothetical protein
VAIFPGSCECYISTVMAPLRPPVDPLNSGEQGRLEFSGLEQ